LGSSLACGFTSSARAQTPAPISSSVSSGAPAASVNPPITPKPTKPAVGATLPVSGKPIEAGLPHRSGGKPLNWDPAFNRMDTPEMILTGAAAGVALAAAILPPLNTGWTRPLGVDTAVRNTLRLPSYQARLDVRDASDVGLALLTSFPILVDSFIVAYWYRGSQDVAEQMALIDAEAFAVAAALQGTATFLSGRARPYVQNCGGQVPTQTIDCQTNAQYRSFFSGHSALSFTSASLICAHHENLDLFDSSADDVTCASAFVAAGAVATFRVVGDAHYFSDVVTGAAVGTLVGLGIPNLHHYRRATEAPPAVTLRFVPTPSSVSILGTF
jgi:membrane-associated phospholipid phosphatase